MKKAALIFANPSLTSFNNYLAEETTKALQNQNFEVKRYNVYDTPLINQNPSEKGFSDAEAKLSDELAAMDAWVIISPMWNFSMPGGLKNFLDVIIQAKKYFRYTKYGIPVGLLKVKKLTLIWTSGSPRAFFFIPGMDHLVSLTKRIRRFCGIKKFQHINFSPILGEIPKEKVEKWTKKIHKLKFI